MRQPLLLVAGIAALIFALALAVAHAAGTPLEAGKSYHGTVVACAAQADAGHLRDLAAAGDRAEINAYMQAQNNTCGVAEDTMFTPVEAVGSTKRDPEHREWRVIRIRVEGAPADLFLVTTSEFIAAPPGGQT